MHVTAWPHAGWSCRALSNTGNTQLINSTCFACLIMQVLLLWDLACKATLRCHMGNGLPWYICCRKTEWSCFARAWHKISPATAECQQRVTLCILHATSYWAWGLYCLSRAWHVDVWTSVLAYPVKLVSNMLLEQHYLCFNSSLMSPVDSTHSSQTLTWSISSRMPCQKCGLL